MKKTVFVFGALIAALLTLFHLSKYSLLLGNSKSEFVIAGIAIVFFLIGIYINKKSARKVSSTNPEPIIDHSKIKELGISKREYEILSEIAKGYSNKEIAEQLFISESTIKTHVSNLFVKLDVKRRTQAVQRAKSLHILE